MNMQGLQYSSQTALSIARPLCVCDTPSIETAETLSSSVRCKKCGKNLNVSSIKAAKKLLIMKELREIKEAKANIRNTLRLQQKRSKDRIEELEFLLKRL